MTRFKRLVCPALLLFMASLSPLQAQLRPLRSPAAAPPPRVIVFCEQGFPASDTAAVSEAELRAAFPGAEFAGATALGAALEPAGRGDLLVMPYGSSYPEAGWKPVLTYLDRGGNVLVLGGKAFTRAAYQEDGHWRLRAASVGASLELYVHDYQQTPGTGVGATELRFLANADADPTLPVFGWRRAFSPVLRLSAVPMYKEDGSTGTHDMDLTPLAWGVGGEGGEHKLAAPVLELDHLQHRFTGARWILVACEPEAGFGAKTDLIQHLAALAMRRDDRFTLRPRVPLLLPGEPLELRFALADPLAPRPVRDTLRIKVSAEQGGAPFEQSVPVGGATQMVTLSKAALAGQGLHTIEATLVRDGHTLTTYRSGFWMRDRAYLLSGPKLGVGPDYFTLDDKPLPVVGTTLMASDVQRLYLMEPNAWIWDQDMAQIHGAGLNMLRSGLWSAWAPELAPNGEVSEDALRTIEAFLMCARHNHLPVQFNLLAFVADNLGDGDNAYLDPVAFRQQSVYIHSLAERFHDVPFLAWDLINEPSANRNHWKTEPDYDPWEQQAWRAWLDKHYGSSEAERAVLLAAWGEPAYGIGRDLQRAPGTNPPEVASQDPFALPQANAFAGPDSVRGGYNPLKIYDYYLFTQSLFADWVGRLRDVIRSTGSAQLVTVGQEENGVGARLSPAFYEQHLDFTADHTWWDFDAALWASLAAKIPGKPMLIQETGEQRRLWEDDSLRFSPQIEGWQLERKIAIAFAQGAGALEWVWHVNSYMANDNEISIGAVRPDGTEKPEAAVLANYAKFAAASSTRFTRIAAPEVVVVQSLALQYSNQNAMAQEVQKHALRALAYYDHTPARMLAENRLAELTAGAAGGSAPAPKLVIVPAAQALTEVGWAQLLAYADAGGTLLICGPVERDEHWHRVDRAGSIGIKAEILPLSTRSSTMALEGEEPVEVSFGGEAQIAPYEVLRFASGKAVESIARGKGQILWAAEPVELAEGYAPAAALYRHALRMAKVEPPFTQVAPLSPGVLAFPTMLENAVLYSFSNESLDAQLVDLQDRATGAHIRFTFAGQRGAMLLLDRKDGRVLAAYGDAAVTKQ